MMGRREFGLAGASLAAAAALGQSAFAQSKQGPTHSEHDEMLQSCAKACSDCQRACSSCSTHCAHQLHAGHKDHMTTLATCQDCADVCGTASEIVARGGP